MTANPHDENAFLLLRMQQLNPRKLLSVSLLKGFRLALTFHFEIEFGYSRRHVHTYIFSLLISSS
jgi:hypothetical protein